MRSHHLQDCERIDNGEEVAPRQLIYVSVDDSDADAAKASADSQWVAIDRSSALAVAFLFSITPADRKSTGPRAVILNGEAFSVINPDATAGLKSDAPAFPWV